jgi:hypothetical protein
MLRDLSPAQRELADYMSGLSERAYAAGWIERLEFKLWSAMSQRTPVLGSLQLAQEEVLRLHSLSDRCGGWITFDEKTEETFVPTSRWLALVEHA